MNSTLEINFHEGIGAGDNNENCFLMSKAGKNKDLPQGFTPSEMDVICGWARQNYHHGGNRRLRQTIFDNVPKYEAAKTKTEKGMIIAEIVHDFKQMSPTGVGFVKMNPKSGRWSFIGTEKAKDKVGHALRKASASLSTLKKGKKSDEISIGHQVDAAEDRDVAAKFERSPVAQRRGSSMDEDSEAGRNDSTAKIPSRNQTESSNTMASSSLSSNVASRPQQNDATASGETRLNNAFLSDSSTSKQQQQQQQLPQEQDRQNERIAIPGGRTMDLTSFLSRRVDSVLPTHSPYLAWGGGLTTSAAASSSTQPSPPTVQQQPREINSSGISPSDALSPPITPVNRNVFSEIQHHQTPSQSPDFNNIPGFLEPSPIRYFPPPPPPPPPPQQQTILAAAAATTAAATTTSHAHQPPQPRANVDLSAARGGIAHPSTSNFHYPPPPPPPYPYFYYPPFPIAYYPSAAAAAAAATTDERVQSGDQEGNPTAARHPPHAAAQPPYYPLPPPPPCYYMVPPLPSGSSTPRLPTGHILAPRNSPRGGSGLRQETRAPPPHLPFPSGASAPTGHFLAPLNSPTRTRGESGLRQETRAPPPHLPFPGGASAPTGHFLAPRNSPTRTRGESGLRQEAHAPPPHLPFDGSNSAASVALPIDHRLSQRSSLLPPRAQEPPSREDAKEFDP